PREVYRLRGARPDLVLDGGRAALAGAIEDAGEVYRGKRAYQVLTVRLEGGRSYQFDMLSAAYQSFVAVEDADGAPLAEAGAPGIGGNCRLAFRPERGGVYRVLATSVGGFRVGPFALTVRDGPPPSALPPWFHTLDLDGDGQISLKEWRAAGRPIDGFAQYDANDDGFITPREFPRPRPDRPELALEKGRAALAGALDEGAAEYRGKTAFKVVTVRLEEGKSYQFDLESPAFQSFLYLEDGDGRPLAENSSPQVGGKSRVRHRAKRTGLYRVVVTSLGGFRPGPFSLSLRDDAPGLDPLPRWFRDLDTDGDGQVSLKEWRAGARPLAAFRDRDRDHDGFITAREAIQ
ncbi:MAG: EF-hand domain-containing protein, partial [Gemmataceae bacterium]|nr:EF-hand domain-containing protein [Gemmataceae bacterium]